MTGYTCVFEETNKNGKVVKSFEANGTVEVGETETYTVKSRGQEITFTISER